MIEKIKNLLKARFPYVYITTFEEQRITKILTRIVTDPKETKYPRIVYVWTQTKGFVEQDTDKAISNTTSAMQALNFVESCNKDAIFLMYDFHVNFGCKTCRPDMEIVRKLRDMVPVLKSGKNRKCVFFIGTETVIPPSLQKEIVVYDFPLPTIDDIKAKFNSMLNTNSKIDISELDEETKDRLCKAALGLTLQEAENAFALSMVNDGKLTIEDINVILEEKMQVIKKTGILEYVQSDLDINDIGGLDNLKKWVKKRTNSWSEAAKKYCLPAPKGILITGIPGCGKSLTAKATSSIWRLPLLRLDMGKIFSGLVGSSEENMRRAISIAEAVAPSILWIDEIEKGLSGVGSSNDSGVASRIFGTFLTWMQEKEAPVFVIATANNISGLPAELLRKGRFDEIFFVDIPTYDERVEIFRVHLRKRLKNKEILGDIEFNDGLCQKLASMTEGFIGAEIEQIVIAALYEAFFENRQLMFRDLEKIINSIVPLSTVQKERILSLREWAKVRAITATDKKALSNYNTDSDTSDKEQDITSSRGGRTIDFE